MDRPPITRYDMPVGFFEIGRAIIDPMITRFTEQVVDIQSALDDGTLSDNEAREFIADLGVRFAPLYGEEVSMRGGFTAQVGDDVHYTERIGHMTGYYGGLLLEPHLAIDGQIRPCLMYRLNATPNASVEEPHALYPCTAPIDFTNIISLERAQAMLAEFPYLDDIDDALLNSEDICETMQQLGKLSFVADDTPEMIARSYGLVARYMTAVSNIHHAHGFVCDLEGYAYETNDNWRRKEISGRATLTDAMFVFNLENPFSPELCVNGIVLQRANVPTASLLAIPVTSFGDISEISLS